MYTTSGYKETCESLVTRTQMHMVDVQLSIAQTPVSLLGLPFPARCIMAALPCTSYPSRTNIPYNRDATTCRTFPQPAHPPGRALARQVHHGGVVLAQRVPRVRRQREVGEGALHALAPHAQPALVHDAQEKVCV